MSRPMLRTERIELRPMTLDHLPHLIELDGDAQVLRFILGRARTESEAIDFWGPICLDAYADPVGLGWWAGFATAAIAGDAATEVPGVTAGEFLGWWDVSPARLDVEEAAARGGVPVSAEAGWRLRRAAWRRGLATEGAAALFAHGFETVGLDVIWAETMAVNAGSRGVMRALGMRHRATDVRPWNDPLPDAEHGEVVYQITRAQWAARLPG